MNVSNQTVLLLLRHIRQVWQGLKLSNNSIFLACILVHFKVVDLHVRYNLSPTLYLLVLMVFELLEFVVFPLISKSNHGAEEYVERLLQDVVLLQSLSIDRGLALSSLIKPVNILDFKDFVSCIGF